MNCCFGRLHENSNPSLPHNPNTSSNRYRGKPERPHVDISHNSFESLHHLLACEHSPVSIGSFWRNEVSFQGFWRFISERFRTFGPFNLEMFRTFEPFNSEMCRTFEQFNSERCRTSTTLELLGVRSMVGGRERIS